MVLRAQRTGSALAHHFGHGSAVVVGRSEDGVPCGVLLIRTNPGTKLVGLIVNDKVAFEVDEVVDDEVWSVVISGTARAIESQTGIDEADKLPLRPWPPL